MTARLSFHLGIVISLVVQMVRTVPISTILQEQYGLITLVALLDVMLYASWNSQNYQSGSKCQIY